MFSEEAIQLVKDAVDVEPLLVSLGFRITRATGGDLRAMCQLHGGDNPTAFSIRLDTKKWRCFTKKCEQDDNGGVNNDLIALVMKANNIPFTEALRYLADFAGLDLDAINNGNGPTAEYMRKKDTESYVRSSERIARQEEPLRQISEGIVQCYVEKRDDYFLHQGFSPATLEHFEIGSKLDGAGVRRATIPIRDHLGGLVSVSARREDSDEEPRYLLDKEFQKGRVLYNLHAALNSGEDKVIIVEGFKALWAVFEAGFTNVVACMGADVTHEQVLLLCNSGFVSCLLMFDGDEAGHSGMIKGVAKLEGAFRVVPVFLPAGKSPDFYSREYLRDFLELYIAV